MKKLYISRILIFLGCSILTISTHETVAQVANLGEFSVMPETLISFFDDLENFDQGTITNDGEFYLHGGLINNGTVSFTLSTSGTFHLAGNSGIQQLESHGITEWNKVTVDHSDSAGVISYTGVASISGTAVLLNGIIKESENPGLVLFKEGSTYAGASDLSHFETGVGWEGSSSFGFPIGDKNSLRIAGVIPQSHGTMFGGKYLMNNPDEKYPRDNTDPYIKLVSDAEYWEITRIEGDGEAKVFLSWKENITPAFILGAPKEEIHVVRWDETSNQWIDLGGDLDMSLNHVTTEDWIDEFGVFTLATATPSGVNLAISKTSFGVSVFVGNSFNYELIVSNVGNRIATDVMVVDNLPDGIEFSEASFESELGLLDGGLIETEVLNGSVVFRIPSFPVKESLVITMKVGASQIGGIINHAEVTSTEFERLPTDNEATDSNEVKGLFIPNVITPAEKDGMNDSFIIEGLNRFEKNVIEIFNRYGDLVFETKDYRNNWSASGLESGTYFYVLQVKEYDGSFSEFKGWVYVIK